MNRVLWLKMRPDTPQHYEYILVENITGNCGSVLYVWPWTQFFQPGDRQMPLSRCNNVVMRGISVKSEKKWNIKASDKYELVDFELDGEPLSL